MGYITGTDSRQMTLAIGCVEGEVSQDSPVWFIAAFVDGLDLEALGFEHAPPAATGRPPYNPCDLVKLYFYGYLNGIRSSRRLTRECRRNVELFFLLNRLCPDFRTIADFRKRHGKLLKKIFLIIFVQACREMKLMDAQTLCLDGTTIRAVNGKKQATSAELSRKKLEYARAQLEAVEKYLDRVFYSAHKGGETRMSSKEIRRRIEIGGNKVWIRANSEQEYADKIIERYRESIGAEEQSGHNFRAFAEKWFEVFKEPNVRKGSQMSYRRQLDVHIYPILGEKDIEDIRVHCLVFKI